MKDQVIATTNVGVAITRDDLNTAAAALRSKARRVRRHAEEHEGAAETTVSVEGEIAARLHAKADKLDALADKFERAAR